MKSSASKIQMTTYDDLFQSDGVPEVGEEKVQEIALSDLFPFQNHPFKVLDDETMQDTAESIRKYGVLVPGIARPRTDGAGNPYLLTSLFRAPTTMSQHYAEIWGELKPLLKKFDKL